VPAPPYRRPVICIITDGIWHIRNPLLLAKSSVLLVLGFYLLALTARHLFALYTTYLARDLGRTLAAKQAAIAAGKKLPRKCQVTAVRSAYVLLCGC
jgi:hypothetical protein